MTLAMATHKRNLEGWRLGRLRRGIMTRLRAAKERAIGVANDVALPPNIRERWNELLDLLGDLVWIIGSDKLLERVVANDFGDCRQLDELTRWVGRLTNCTLIDPTPKPDTPILIEIAAVIDRYHVSKPTVRRAVAEGRLTDHRPPRHAQNARLRLDEKEVAGLWPRRR